MTVTCELGGGASGGTAAKESSGAAQTRPPPRTIRKTTRSCVTEGSGDAPADHRRRRRLATRRPDRAPSGRGVLVTAEDDLSGKRPVPGHLDRHLAPLGSMMWNGQWLAHVVFFAMLPTKPLDSGGGSRARPAGPSLPAPGALPCPPHGWPGTPRRSGAFVAWPAVDDRNGVRRRARFQPADEPRQEMLASSSSGAVMQPRPPESEPARVAPRREAGVRPGRPTPRRSRPAGRRTEQRNPRPRADRTDQWQLTSAGLPGGLLLAGEVPDKAAAW